MPHQSNNMISLYIIISHSSLTRCDLQRLVALPGGGPELSKILRFPGMLENPIYKWTMTGGTPIF